MLEEVMQKEEKGREQHKDRYNKKGVSRTV
jgi:hypothetical protein